MKAPAFWYQPKNKWGRLLAPLGHIYRLAGLVRRARATPYHSCVPVLCVGNIVAGGAGKTPTCLALRKLLLKNDPLGKTVFVMRGYGGRELGPLRVEPKTHTSADVGDEPLLLARSAPCWIGQDRAATIQAAEKEASVIIMDDGMQNPHVAPMLTLLVIDGAVGLGNKKLIPAGPLRETLNDAFPRIDAIIMIGEDAHQVATYLGKPVFKAKLWPSISTEFMNKPNVLAFAGIGRPQKFYDSCHAAGLTVIETQDFPDHHVFTDDELALLADRATHKGLRLITTAKDYVRLPNAYRAKVAVLDITLTFDDEAGLINLVSKCLAKNA